MTSQESSPPEGQQAQSWNHERYERNARFVSDLGLPVVELLAAKSGERVLDLGCGDGVLTKKLVEAGLSVKAVDASPEFIETARSLGLDAQVMDGHALDFEQEFDAVFSNAAMHWMTRPDEVIAGVARALKPGGRFVAEFGGFMNVGAVRGALYAVLARRGIDAAKGDPWYFPSNDEYAARLRRHGFVIDSMQHIPRPTLLPGELTGWLETFAESFLKLTDSAEHAAIMQEVADLLAPMLRDEAGRWWVDYYRLRFAARLDA